MQRRIDPNADRAVYKQVADILRDDILSGTYRPGETLPSETRLQQELEVGLNSIRNALVVLRGEGLIVTESRRGSYVRERTEPTMIDLPNGAYISARMPTEQERRRLARPDGTPLPEGVPIVEVEADGEKTIYPADQFAFKTGGSEPGQA